MRNDDILRHTWAYQEIMQEGVEKEREQRLKDQCQTLMTIIQTNFPNIVDLAKTQTGALKDPDILQNLMLKIFSAKTEEEAKQALLSVGRKKK
jgi:hypothetical protein